MDIYKTSLRAIAIEILHCHISILVQSLTWILPYYFYTLIYLMTTNIRIKASCSIPWVLLHTCLGDFYFTILMTQLDLGGVGHCLHEGQWVPNLFYFICIHILMYFQQYTLLCTDMKWVTLALNPPHSLNNYTDFLCVYINIMGKNCKTSPPSAWIFLRIADKLETFNKYHNT